MEWHPVNKGMADLGSARVVGLHQLFFMHHPLKRAFDRRDFLETGFKDCKVKFSLFF